MRFLYYALLLVTGLAAGGAIHLALLADGFLATWLYAIAGGTLLFLGGGMANVFHREYLDRDYLD